MLARLSLVVLLLIGSPAAALSIRPGGPPSSPGTWAVASANGRYLFVMRATDEDRSEVGWNTSAEREAARKLWAKYPKSGLYRTATGEPVWQTDERFELRSRYQNHHVLVADAGATVVWLAHVPYGPPKYPPRSGDNWWGFGNQTFVQSTSLGGGHSESADGLGVRILTGGRTVGGHAPAALIARPDRFDNETAYGYSPWIADAELEGERLRLGILDGQTLTFDLTDGTLVERQSGTRAVPWGWLIGGVAFAAVAVGGVVVLRRRPQAAVLLALPLVGSPALALSIDPSYRPPSSWHQDSPNGRFVFVMIDPDPTRDRECYVRTDPRAREKADDLRRRYPRSGVYRTDTDDCVWDVAEWFENDRLSGGYTALVSNDGEHAVWLSAVPVARPKPQGAVDRWWNGERQTFSMLAPSGHFGGRKDQPAVRILGRGRHAAFTHADLIRDPEQFPKTIPFAFSWFESAEIAGTELRVVTNDDQTLTFDLRTGALANREATRERTWPAWPGAVVLVVAVGWLVWCRAKRRAVTAPDRMPVTS